MAQQILAAVIVIVAVAYSAWRLMPARRRLALLVALDAWAARHPALSAWRARALQPRITRAGGTGCSSCSAAPTHTHRPR